VSGCATGARALAAAATPATTSLFMRLTVSISGTWHGFPGVRAGIGITGIAGTAGRIEPHTCRRNRPHLMMSEIKTLRARRYAARDFQRRGLREISSALFRLFINESAPVIIAAYADPNRHRGKNAMTRMIESIRRGVPAGLDEIAQLGRQLSRRRTDILAFYDLSSDILLTAPVQGC
jgi:hypothetical protein